MTEDSLYVGAKPCVQCESDGDCNNRKTDHAPSGFQYKQDGNCADIYISRKKCTCPTLQAT